MNKKIKKYVAGAALLALLGTATATAYFTSTDSAINNFTVGSVRIKLHEDKWDALPDANNNKMPDVAENITPSKVLVKDPAIENTGKNAAWVFIEVKIPTKSIITAGDDGTRNTAASTELFSYKINTDWTQLNKKADADVMIYTYGYATTLAPGKTTPTLFDSIEFCNAIETQGLEDSAQKIEVKSMAIQSEQTGTLQEGYAKYVAQNK